MNAIALRRSRNLTLIVLAVLLVFSSLSFTTHEIPERRPNQGLSNIVPFLGIFRGLRSRNRLYRTANAYIAERTTYYDALRAKALEQLEREGLTVSQYKAHKRMVALVEQERAAMIEFAESEKFAARQRFLKRLEGAIVYRLIGSGLAQDLFRAMSNGINSANGIVDIALGKITGGEGVVGELQQVRTVASRVNALASVIGGKTGRNLRRASQRVISTIDRPLEEIESGLVQVQGDLAQMRELFTALQETARDVDVIDAAKQIFEAEITGAEIEDPVVASIVEMLTKAASDGDGTFRSRARAAILGTFAARCTTKTRNLRDELAKLADDPDYQPASDVEIISACNPFDVEGEGDLFVEDAGESADSVSEDGPCEGLTEAECANAGTHRFFLTTQEIECDGAAQPGEFLIEITFEENKVTLYNLEYGWVLPFDRVEENVYSGTSDSGYTQTITFTTEGHVNNVYLGGKHCYIYSRELLD